MHEGIDIDEEAVEDDEDNDAISVRNAELEDEEAGGAGCEAAA